MSVLEKVKKALVLAREEARVETEPASLPVPDWVDEPIEAAPLTEASVFCAVADKFESEEWIWIRGSEWIDAPIPMACVWGGLERLTGKDYLLLNAASDRFLRITKEASIVSWNDAPGRTKKQVIATLRRVGDCSTP